MEISSEKAKDQALAPKFETSAKDWLDLLKTTSTEDESLFLEADENKAKTKEANPNQAKIIKLGTPKASPTPPNTPTEKTLQELSQKLFKSMRSKNEVRTKEILKTIQNLPIIDQSTKDRYIQKAQDLACNFRNLDQIVASALKACDPLSEEVIAIFKEISLSKTWYLSSFEQRLRPILIDKFQYLLRTEDLETCQEFLNQAKFFGTWVAGLLDPYFKALTLEAPQVFKGKEHRIHKLAPAKNWYLYIDESSSKAGMDKGLKVVGVLVNDPYILPSLGPNFHAKEKPASTVLNKFNQLLEANCGILGLYEPDLQQTSHNTWLKTVLELILWVWRLIPLDSEQSSLHICIEECSEYKPNEDLKWLSLALNHALDKESLKRAEHLLLTKDALRFVKKGTELIGWADVAAYMWGSTQVEIRKGLEASGLKDTCFLKEVKAKLPLWAKALKGEALEKSGWQFLMEQKDQALTEHCLKSLKKLCRQEVDLWPRYVEATSDYLATKNYDLKVLERECAWLAETSSQDLKPEMRFFWKLTELANFNHKGDISAKAQKTAKEVEELAPKIGHLKPEATWQAALRLAVFEANRFDFFAAKEKLKPWDPLENGQLTGSALWDGKILSSLGQYEAFNKDNKLALDYFSEALECFKKLSEIDPIGSKLQIEQTSIYAAIAAMDVATFTLQTKKDYLEKALGQSVPQACKTFAALAKKTIVLNIIFWCGFYLTMALTKKKNSTAKIKTIGPDLIWALIKDILGLSSNFIGPKCCLLAS